MKDSKLRFSIICGIFLWAIISGHPVHSFANTQSFTLIQEPDGISIPVDTPLNLTLLNNLETDINTVVMHYCSLEPEFVCHFPSIIVEKNAFDAFSIVFTPEYGINTVLGYNFEITMENGSIYKIPNSLEYSDSQSIRKASDNFYYFSLDIVRNNQSTHDTSASTQTSGFSIMIILSLLISLKIKKRSIKNSKEK